MKIKKFNKNPFEEKLLHRYLLEGLYLRRPKVIQLLPKKFQNLQINAVIPEAKTEYVRPDFKVYFKGNPNPLWIEVKWTANSSFSKKQLDFLSTRNNLLATIGGDFSKYPKNIFVSKLDPEDIERWLKFSATKLWRDAIYDYGVVTARKPWLLVLRGNYKENWQKMERIAKSKNSLFWAFKNQASSFESIFNISAGDWLYLMDLKLEFGPQAIPKNPKATGVKKIMMSKFEVIDPHFIIESPKNGSIFEKKENMPIYLRKWIHFIKFKQDSIGSECKLDKNSENQIIPFWNKIASSGNLGGGSPIELSLREASILDGLF